MGERLELDVVGVESLGLDVIAVGPSGFDSIAVDRLVLVVAPVGFGSRCLLTRSCCQ